MTPQLTHKQALQLVDLAGQHLELNFTKYPAGFFIGIRGYYRDTLGKPGTNDVGLYDDMIAWVTPDKIHAIQANTDPSRIGWNSALGKPFAMLVPGLWYFVRGAHKGRTPAFRQPHEQNARDFNIPNKGYFTVYRAKSQDQVTQHTAPTETGYFAINIHDGADDSTSSWGCLTGRRDRFVDWANRIWKETRALGQDKLPFLLMENTHGSGKQLLDSLPK